MRGPSPTLKSGRVARRCQKSIHKRRQNPSVVNVFLPSSTVSQTQGEENPRKVALHQSENPPHHLLYAALLTGISFIFICICIFNYQGAHIRSLSASVVVGIFDVGLFGCYLGSCEGLGGLVSVVFVRSGLIVGCARMR